MQEIKGNPDQICKSINSVDLDGTLYGSMGDICNLIEFAINSVEEVMDVIDWLSYTVIHTVLRRDDDVMTPTAKAGGL